MECFARHSYNAVIAEDRDVPKGQYFMDEKKADYETHKVIFRDIPLLCMYAGNQWFAKSRFSLNIKKYP